jgi:hypothetical protein
LPSEHDNEENPARTRTGVGPYVRRIQMSERLTKRTASIATGAPYGCASVKVDVFDQYEFMGDTIVPGDKIRIHKTRGLFTFRQVATNTATGSTWVDTYESKTGFFRSFPVSRIKSKVRPKKPRKYRTKVAYIG